MELCLQFSISDVGSYHNIRKTSSPLVVLVEWVWSIYTRSKGLIITACIYPSSDYGHSMKTLVHVIFFLSWSQLHIQDGDVPLGVAALKGHTQTVERLFEAGANVNHQNKVMTMTVEMHVFSHVLK